MVFNPDDAPDAHKVAEQLRSEWVLQVVGVVSTRPEGTENPSLPTGAVEVAVERVTVLNESKTPPFEVSEDGEADELLRLKHRYLDLRRPSMRDILVLRHQVVKFIRDFLSARGFLEIETPILIKSTPEGRPRPSSSQAGRIPASSTLSLSPHSSSSNSSWQVEWRSTSRSPVASAMRTRGPTGWLNIPSWTLR